MARDLKTVSTDALRSEYEPKRDKIKALRAELKALESDAEPLKLELAAREEKETLILNAVMAGQQGLLRATGVPDATIAAAEAQFKAMREAKLAARGEAVAS